MKEVTFDEAKRKVYKYCAYQERSHQEVRRRLYELGLKSAQVNELVTHLITEGFLNEERFAKAFASGKFRLKKWGKLKIVRELEGHGLTANCIRIGLREIDTSDYLRTIGQLVKKNAISKKVNNVYVWRDRVAKSVIQKGFEPDLVWQEVKKTIPE
jgi:regulatory protein